MYLHENVTGIKGGFVPENISRTNGAIVFDVLQKHE